MKYPSEYWVKHFRYWWVTLGALFLTLVILFRSIKSGEGLITFCAGAIFGLVVYYRILRVDIPKRSAIMDDGKIVEICLRGERRMIWEPNIFGNRIVLVACEEVTGRIYDSLVVFPAQGYQVCICSINITLEHIMHSDAWQRFYDNIVMEKGGRMDVIRSVIDNALNEVRRPPIHISGEKDEMVSHVVSPLTNALNRALKPYGLVARVDCKIKSTAAHVIPKS